MTIGAGGVFSFFNGLIITWMQRSRDGSIIKNCLQLETVNLKLSKR